MPRNYFEMFLGYNRHNINTNLQRILKTARECSYILLKVAYQAKIKAADFQ